MSILPMGHEYKIVRKYSRKITAIVIILSFIISCFLLWWGSKQFDGIRGVVTFVAILFIWVGNSYFLEDIELKDEYRK